MASIQVTASHPQITIDRTLNVADDAKLLELADLLIDSYGPDENGDPLNRQQAIGRFLDGMLNAARDEYRRLKRLAEVAVIQDSEIDA
jgi:hypothetical protein